MMWSYHMLRGWAACDLDLAKLKPLRLQLQGLQRLWGSRQQQTLRVGEWWWIYKRRGSVCIAPTAAEGWKQHWPIPRSSNVTNSRSGKLGGSTKWYVPCVQTYDYAFVTLLLAGVITAASGTSSVHNYRHIVSTIQHRLDLRGRYVESRVCSWLAFNRMGGLWSPDA